MVAFLPISLWIVGLFAVVQVLKPRLPKYTFRIKRIIPNWISKQGFHARLGSKVRLHNDNYVPIDIHALSFDLFYPDWNGHLDHIGQVTDVLQHKESTRKDRSPPLWELSPRQAFETTDNVLMKPAGGFGVISSLSWDLMRNWGIVLVPSSGVMHVKANSKVPMTLSILCDNSLDGWTLEMQGLSCELDALDIGWVDLPTAVGRLRTKVTKRGLDEIMLPELPPTIPDEVVHLIKWDDILPMLTL